MVCVIDFLYTELLSSSFLLFFHCCSTWCFNVMQSVLYSPTCRTTCLSNTFCLKYCSLHLPSFVQTNFRIVQLVHAQQSCYASRNNGELLDNSWDIFLPSCAVVTQIRSEFLTCIGALIQEDVCEVHFLCIRLKSIFLSSVMSL